MSGELFGSVEEQLHRQGELTAPNPMLMSDKAKRRLAEQRVQEMMSQLANPMAQQAAAQREMSRQSVSPEGHCSHCKGTGRAQGII
jgi:hypothetical protein